MLWMEKPSSPVCGEATQSCEALWEKEIDISLVKSAAASFFLGHSQAMSSAGLQPGLLEIRRQCRPQGRFLASIVPVFLDEVWNSKPDEASVLACIRTYTG